ncbi:MAG: glycoside hydrolase family 88 protein [Bacteroidales bacterium]|nr:glycoside hydrolase family 88 protein [Bacteroidales bacterium]
MKKTALIALVALTACTAKAPLSLRVVESEMARCPEATFLDGQEGRLKWNYTTGLELKSFLDVYEATGREEILDYVDAWYDAIIAEDGTIATYKKSNYSTDHVCPGRTLFQLYDITGKEKYRTAMDSLYVQVLEQPRTEDGGFWHKQVYPGQMWLDGLYMAQPFYVEYTNRFVSDSTERAENYADIVHQFTTVYAHTFDPTTGLLRHAWDSTGEMDWSDPETGQSDHAWGRALGWYCMALVDVAELMPDGSDKDTLVRILQSLYGTIPLYADARTGMWFQVMDSPYRQGNYLEATASAMFIYVWLKGIRLGFLTGREPALQAYESLLKTFVTEKDGLVDLNDCCAVAGLGGKDNRRGDFDYYIHEPVRANDPKGIGPLVCAALEYERL